MVLIFSSKEFEIHKQVYENFPLLFNQEMQLIEPVHHFLVYYCLHRGRVNSKHSWAKYGQDLYDYFGFLEAYALTWNQFTNSKEVSIVAAYRDWAIHQCNLKNTTVNQRLKTIVAFYKYAYRKNWISSLPFDFEMVSSYRGQRFLAHIYRSGGQVVSPDIMLKTYNKPLKILSIAQVKQLLSVIRNLTHKLMVRLALQTGMRREEIATFPVEYIFNPDLHNNIKNNIRVELQPKDMRTKGSKSRKIDISRLLMEDLWDYVIHSRPARERCSGKQQDPLFLNEQGQPFSQNGKGFGVILNKLPLDFKVTPHMLRHTYATHTLYAMRKRGSKNDPLMYLRERLGHSSINTTMIYLHYLDEIEDDLIDQFQQEVDAWSREDHHG